MWSRGDLSSPILDQLFDDPMSCCDGLGLSLILQSTG